MASKQIADQKSPRDPIYRRKAFIPVLLFFFLFIFLLLSTRLTGRPPQIHSVNPRIGYPGDIMVIQGKYFGDQRNGGEVSIADYAPTSSGYLEWRDERITLRIPDDVKSGPVYVRTRRGRSKEVLFANQEQIPVVLSGPGAPGQPFISELNAESGPIGTLLTLTGMNFGPERGDSQVFFAWISGEEASQYGNADDAASPLTASLTPALEYDQDYEVWSDREIQVRVPDGAHSGQILVVTDKGESNALYFEVKGTAGTKLFPEKRTYAVQYGIDIRDIAAEAGNSLYLWVPQILEAPEQRGMQLVSQEPEPLFDNVGGLKLVAFQDLKEGSSYRVLQGFMFDRYSIATKVNPAKLRPYDEFRKLFKKYTVADGLIPSDHERIQQLGKAIVGRERNPYRRARAVYYWVLKRLEPAEGEEAETRDVIQALDSRRGGSFIYSALFCALTRAVSIPSRPVAGYLIDRGLKGYRHYWAEFYLEELGWLPVDPLLGEGGERAPLSPEIDPRSYYFGNMDFSHITFSKGVIPLNQLNPEGRTVSRVDVPSLQLFHEEAVGNLSNYSAYWSEIEVQGIY